MRLSEHLHRELNGNPDARVWFREWNSPWKEIAGHIALIRKTQLYPALFQVRIYAHSWGGGWGAPRLARALQRDPWPIPVPKMILADPVYRHPLWSLSWLSMFPGREITVPSNVGEVIYFLQDKQKPMGHRVVAEQERCTKVGEPTVFHDKVHGEMDEIKEFHEACVQAAVAAHPKPSRPASKKVTKKKGRKK